jgi:hypothetical protein
LSPWVATVMTICTDKPHNKCTRYARKGLQPISHNKSSSKARDTRHTKQNPPGHFCEPRHRTTCSVVYNGPGGPDAHTPPRQGMVAPKTTKGSHQRPSQFASQQLNKQRLITPRHLVVLQFGNHTPNAVLPIVHCKLAIV